MNFRAIQPDSSVSLFVKDILVFDEPNDIPKTVLPFFADGYPGLLFHETPGGLRVNPHDKLMPALFLYGQTIRPVELELHGSYRMIVFQLYPFVLKRFFGVNPKEINDGCYDLGPLFPETLRALGAATAPGAHVQLLQTLLESAFHTHKEALDLQMREAVRLILENKGRIVLQTIADALHLTTRTFERRFAAATGIPPKQFAQIIQFQLSLGQLTVKDYTKLSDIVYANGFADQSHFIRVFKAYTGQTPKKFRPERY